MQKNSDKGKVNITKIMENPVRRMAQKFAESPEVAVCMKSIRSVRLVCSLM